MLFFNRTTRWILMPLADTLEQPDCVGAPLSSKNPLLRRILTGAEHVLHERRLLKEQAQALTLEVAELCGRLAERDAVVKQWASRWALITQGCSELFWELELSGLPPLALESAMVWSGR